MLPPHRGEHHESGTTRRNSPGRSQRPRCVLPPQTQGWAFKGTSSPRGRRGINISGVDFWHAVEFSRNGRFLCACFTRPSGRFPSVLRFRLYQTLAAPIFTGAIPPFGLFAVPTLPDPFPSLAPCWSGPTVRLSLFGFSDSSRFQSAPFPARIGFRLPVERGLPFGFSDFIRSAAAEFIGRGFR